MHYHGSQPLKPDPRDKNFTDIAFGAATLPTFPKTLNRPRQPVKNQGDSQSCTKQTTELASGYQEGKVFSAAWAWMQLCKSQNSYLLNGADPRAAMGINCKKGSLLEVDAQHSFPGDPQEIANWNNWINIDYQAEQYEKAAYVHIPRVDDWFDSIRSALVTGQDKSQVVMAFGRWFSNWRGAVIPPELGTQTGWHAYTFIDFDTIDGVEYLIAQNSYGTAWGDNGFQYFSREVVNREFSVIGTGLYVFIDLTPDQINLAKQETVFGRIQRAIIDLWWKVSQSFGSVDQQLTLLRQLLAAYTALRDHLIATQKAPQTTPAPKPIPVSPPVHSSELLRKFCLAIQEFEGYYAPGEHPKYPNGTPAWRNKNPGNLRSSPSQMGTRDGFAYFATYEQGFAALMTMIRNAAAGNSRVYRPDMTISQFFATYAPASDNNYPAAYARFVAKRMGVPVDTPIKSLFA